MFLEFSRIQSLRNMNIHRRKEYRCERGSRTKLRSEPSRWAEDLLIRLWQRGGAVLYLFHARLLRQGLLRTESDSASATVHPPVPSSQWEKAAVVAVVMEIRQGRGKGARESKGRVGIQVAATGSRKQQREAEAELMPHNAWLEEETRTVGWEFWWEPGSKEPRALSMRSDL